jgi:quercetin 2,3-dioxygenase
MSTQIPGKIFLADQRGVVETAQFQRHSTLSFGMYQHPHRGPVGRLHALNEELLAGGHRATVPVTTDSWLLLLPITGAVTATVGTTPATTTDVGELRVLRVKAGQNLTFQNPYPSDLIRFLHLWLRADDVTPAAELFHFDAAALQNQLAPLLPPTAGWPFGLSLGRFAGRHEAVYRPQPGAQLVAFVIAGAFEAEGRLLHEKDALALWDAAEIEVEALSNDALLLLLELPA